MKQRKSTAEPRFLDDGDNTWEPRAGDIVAYRGQTRWPMVITWANDHWKGRWRISARYQHPDGTYCDGAIGMRGDFTLIRRPMPAAVRARLKAA